MLGYWGVVLSWPVIQTGSAYERVCTHSFSLTDQAREVLGYVEDYNENIIYNDCPAKIPKICQIDGYTVSEGEPLLSDGN